MRGVGELGADNVTGEANEAAAEEGPRDTRGVVGGRNLPVAIAVGVVMAGMFLGALFWHPIAFTVVVAIVTVVAYIESHRAMAPVGNPLPVPVLIVATMVMLFGAFEARHTGQTIGVLVLLLGTMAWQLADAKRSDSVRSMSITVLFGLWVGYLGSFAVLLIQHSPGGVVGVLAVIGAAIFTDIGGYAFGVTLGRHKISPIISPNKSWEGLIGGLALATVLGATVLPALDESFTPLLGAAIAAACGLASFIGDLTQSLIKRDLGLKDFGDVLPGHGGVLDRVDGILIALPVGYFILEVAL